jgi:hypothetical protein
LTKIWRTFAFSGDVKLAFCFSYAAASSRSWATDQVANSAGFADGTLSTNMVGLNFTKVALAALPSRR